MDNMEVKIATNIETEIFYSTIKFLEKNGWKLIAEYKEEIFDKGIDLDLYQFRKSNDTIILVLEQLVEGEIKASTKVLNEIAEHFNIILKFGDPKYLHNPNIMAEMKDFLKFKK